MGLPVLVGCGLPHVSVGAVVHPGTVGREGLPVVAGGHVRFLGQDPRARAEDQQERESTREVRSHSPLRKPGHGGHRCTNRAMAAAQAPGRFTCPFS